MNDDALFSSAEVADQYLGLLGTRWRLGEQGVAIMWRGRVSLLVPYASIQAVRLRPLNALTRGSILLDVPGRPRKQIAADEYAVLNRGMPLRFEPVNQELAAFAKRIEARLGGLAHPGVDLRK